MKNLSVADSLLWQCHICFERFPSSDGGLCSRCRRATCLLHIRLRHSKTLRAARHKAIICSACADPTAAERYPGEPLLRGVLSFLARAAAAWRTRGRPPTPRA